MIRSGDAVWGGTHRSDAVSSVHRRPEMPTCPLTDDVLEAQDLFLMKVLIVITVNTYRVT